MVHVCTTRGDGRGVDERGVSTYRALSDRQTRVNCLAILGFPWFPVQPPVMGDDELRRLTQERAAASDAIVNSAARKRLIVSGPGTGKTFTFQEALKAAGGKGLALTFIRNLVAELNDALAELADVYSFHGFCKHLMHQHDIAGLNDGDYYPPLFHLLVHDIFVLSDDVIHTRDVELHFHDLDEQDGLIARVLERADYYTAVSHTDLVYRVLRHFEAAPNAIPTYALIVVDEIQDFSQQEIEFIKLLSSKNNILAAGDDDQALYVGLKHAMPAFIRGLATGHEYDSFELPYCSRCTEVVVAAVNDVVTKATAEGCLVGRLPKKFSCYTPDKGQESEEHPKIIYAQCSTENMPYAGRYIAQQIARIPAADIERSRKKKYPTALVIGPNPFLDRAFKEVIKTFPNARMKTGSRSEIYLLDGYRRLAKNEASRVSAGASSSRLHHSLAMTPFCELCSQATVNSLTRCQTITAKNICVAHVS